MRRLLIIVVFSLALFLATPTSFSHANLDRIGVLVVFAAIDYDQSCDAFFGRTGYYELNPLLGKHPRRGELLAFGIVGVALVWAASEALPEPWSTVVVDSVIASEGFNIEDNARILDGQRRRINGIPILITVRW